MQKILLSVLCFSVLVFALTGTSYCWQGRMGGMGNPYGLVSDESDFLIHPAKITQGEGIRFYGDYRFTYTGVTDWDNDLYRFNYPSGIPADYFLFDTSGQETTHDVLLGTAFPLGPGRMGFFFSYSGKRGDYDGNEYRFGNYHDVYNLGSKHDNFDIKFLFGLPVMGLDMGLELGMAHCNEGQETWFNLEDFSSGRKNYPLVAILGASLFDFMIPHDSRYWELQWKTGIAKRFDSWAIDVSLRGGHIISSDNTYEYIHEQPVGTIVSYVDMGGEVAGWRLGSEIWLGYNAGNGLTLPFVFSVDYAEKNRDGDGIGTFASIWGYEHDEDALAIKVGGGIEKHLGDDALVGVGLYYAYLRKRDALQFYYRYSWGGEGDYESDKYPLHQEHSAILKGIFEKELSPLVALRMGLDVFYGWAKEELKNNRITNVVGSLPQTDVSSLDGPRWGIAGSIGGSIKFKPFTLEPFLTVGYQESDLSGDGKRIVGGATSFLLELDKTRREWFIGGGLSVLFDLP